ncbi:choline dehydrogenase 3 [Heterobasidion irregulare TC 32-1]|uniref:Choline dehydrogenase 3 n=1 Tax=Heterobasidion irregulare (strain TC 32-1) TaxID=747525 RepID=W4JQ35_HETIT|nr:choline dehydrogenase 3 [Heterobasidion irregulare TC 32-1]ETW75677.1 choline dehydrogenase 3 [Heterobasidion irregulare TC 32-1]
MPFVKAGDVANKKFDYVIVGGGTAGLVLATRLSEDPNTSVLVIEAGPANLDDNLLLRLASFAAQFGQEQYDWFFRTVPQEKSDGTQFFWPRFIRPSEAQIKEQGLDLATWELGTEGPIKLIVPPRVTPADLQSAQTLQAAGIPLAPAPLNGDPRGWYPFPITVDPKGFTRSYATTGYYLPNAARPNLSLLLEATVTKVLTESAGTGTALSATGVQFTLKGDTGTVHAVHAGKEVILSAGSIKTPQLLELSGIGNREILEKHGITVALDLPAVGENMQEHSFVATSFQFRDDLPYETFDVLRDPTRAAKELEAYAKGEGFFTTAHLGFVFAPLEWLSPRGKALHDAHKEKYAAKRDAYPVGLREQYDIMVGRLDGLAPGCELLPFAGFSSFPNPPAEGKKYFSYYLSMNHQWSRGSTHIASADPHAQPAIDPKYFDEEIDLETFVETIKFVRSLRNFSPFKELLVDEVNPGPNVKTDDDIRAWLKKHMSTTFHTAGTASMLPREKGGVVDPQLRVYGTANLRVVDLSVVPLLFAAHTQSVVYALAEQAADLIKGAL